MTIYGKGYAGKLMLCLKMVGVERFELPTLWFQTTDTTSDQARYTQTQCLGTTVDARSFPVKLVDLLAVCWR